MRGQDRFVRRRRRVRLGRARWALAVLAAGLVVAGLVWVMFWSTWLGVHDVRVEGTRALDPHDVLVAAEVEDGRPLARVDLAAVAARVEELPLVETAHVSRSWPRAVSIDVTERTAVAVVSDGATMQALDRHGVLFKNLRRHPKGLPVVKFTAADDVRTDALAEVARVVSSLDPSVAHKVAEIKVASMDAIEFRMRSGDLVRWGTAKESDRKAEVLLALLEHKASTYDVTAPERPTTKS